MSETMIDIVIVGMFVFVGLWVVVATLTDRGK